MNIYLFKKIELKIHLKWDKFKIQNYLKFKDTKFVIFFIRL